MRRTSGMSPRYSPRYSPRSHLRDVAVQRLRLHAQGLGGRQLVTLSFRLAEDNRAAGLHAERQTWHEFTAAVTHTHITEEGGTHHGLSAHISRYAVELRVMQSKGSTGGPTGCGPDG